MIQPLGLALDGLLALTLLWLAWRVLASADLFKSIVFFIAFGLVMALIWVRLGAPDVALAEAAIGAGLTGALFLAALSRLRQGEGGMANGTHLRRANGLRFGAQAALISLLITLFLALGFALLSLQNEAPGLSREVADMLSASGVSNPVTAVLLNFRAYDTLLEMGVLLLAVIAAWSLSAAPKEAADAPGPVLGGFVRLLLPLMILVSSYLLWVGAYAPGGAFQAGAILAAAAVLLLLSGRSPRASGWLGWPLRAILCLGLAVFIAIGLALTFAGRLFLDYPPDEAGNIILVIEVVATVSIGATLAALFAGGRPQQDKRE